MNDDVVPLVEYFTYDFYICIFSVYDDLAES